MNILHTVYNALQVCILCTYAFNRFAESCNIFIDIKVSFGFNGTPLPWLKKEKTKI